MFAADFSDWQGVGQNVARDIAPGEKGQVQCHQTSGSLVQTDKVF